MFLSLTQSPLGFAARSYGYLSSWHWNPGQRGLVWGWDSLLLRYPSQIFMYHTWMWDQPVPHLCPPTSLDGCGFFNSVVVRLPFHSISDSSEWWWFYISAVILMWLCEEASHVYLCRHLDWKWRFRLETFIREGSRKLKMKLAASFGDLFKNTLVKWASSKSF